MGKIMNKIQIEKELRNGGSIKVNNIDWKIQLLDKAGRLVGHIRFDTYLKLNMKVFNECGFEIGWLREFELKDKDATIWR